MIWMILIMGLVAGAGMAIGFWLFAKIGSTDRIIEPYQTGTLYQKFQEDLDIDRPKPESYKE